MAIARGESQICELSSFSGEFLPRGRSRVHLVPFPYLRSSSMPTPRDLDRAKTTGDRRRGIGFLRPQDSYRRFSWHGSIYLFSPPPKGRRARWMDRGLDPCRSGKIIRMPFEPFRHSLDLASKTSVFPTNNRGSFVVFHR